MGTKWELSIKSLGEKGPMGTKAPPGAYCGSSVYIWEEFMSLHIVSKQCHFFLNFGALFETLLNWSHQNRNVSKFQNCEQSKNISLIGLNQASGDPRGPGAKDCILRQKFHKLVWNSCFWCPAPWGPPKPDWGPSMAYFYYAHSFGTG